MLFIGTLLVINIIVAIIISIYCKLTTGICKCSRHLVGKTVIITGGNSGIGLEIAKDLASRGARVILAYNAKKEGTAVRDLLIECTGNDNVCCRELDLASLASVKEFADGIINTEKRIDILINNAEIFEGENIKTKDGLSLYMQVNYFGHFLLTSLLLPLLKSSSPCRIINISSDEHRRGKFELDNIIENATNDAYNLRKEYRKAKICNILMTLELARRLEGTGITSNCLNPGIIFTAIEGETTLLVRYIQKIVQQFLKTPWEGAQTTIFLAVSPEVEFVSGKYYSDCREKIPARCARDKDVARKLWEISEELVGLKKIKNDFSDY
ncbi:unnamed protein product [Arctia plantaginis]|uniref:Uncharacterized protein n=1 Tax=Arctia plantaginis TaxID=874455 RepID=A0A8S1A240_ARCPL|nr:unnamed protein product [Arctia plantaginis]